MSGHRVASDMANAPLGTADPGDAGRITIDKYGQLVEMGSATGAETRTLSAPTDPGILATLRMKEDNGDIVVTASAGLNVAGNTTAPFADVGDQIVLLSVSATTGYRWEIVVNTGSVALA